MLRIPDQIFSSLIRDLFDARIMGNLYRPHYIERMVAIGLGEGFKLVSADWAGWDIEGPKGLRIEVKQSAARQTWTNRPSLAGKPTTRSFDIASRKGYYSDGGSEWVPKPGRHAHIYILAWHPIADETEADHRDPAQWLFFIVPAKQLPQDQKTISRTVVEKRWSAVRFEQLREMTLNTSKKLLKD